LVARKEKFPDYSPIGDEVSVGSTLVQAAIALDLAGKFAEETKDAALMVRVAETWIEMAGCLAHPEGTSDEDDEDGAEPVVTDGAEYPLGFASAGVNDEVKRQREARNGSRPY
jgi:hypothetical protein